MGFESVECKLKVGFAIAYIFPVIVNGIFELLKSTRRLGKEIEEGVYRIVVFLQAAVVLIIGMILDA